MPPRITGTCEMCGAKELELYPGFFGRMYIGFVCMECMNLIKKSEQRLFVPLCEETEPEE